MAEKVVKKRRHINTNIDFEINSPVLKGVLSALLALLMVTVTVYQIYVSAKPKKVLPTETASLTTVYTGVDAQAVAIRNETVLNRSSSGTVVPMVENGSKVAVNDVVAGVYANVSDAQKATTAEEVKKEIDFYENIAALSPGNLVAGIKMYNGNVANRLLELLNAVDGGNLNTFSSCVSDFNESLTKKQIAIGGQVDVSPKLQSLYAQLQTLEAHSGSFSTVTAPQSGYYVNTVDGFEGIYDYSAVASLTDTQVAELMNKAPSGTASNVGKLITEFNWYLVCAVNAADVDTLSVGDRVKISVDELGGETLTMKLKAKNLCENDRVVLVFSSNIMNSSIADLRFSQIKIRVKEYSGYTVNKKAVRTVDGVVGVYIQLGNVIRFRAINIIYSDDNICLSEATSKDNYLKLYDEIIVEGVDNDDGRIVE